MNVFLNFRFHVLSIIRPVSIPSHTTYSETTVFSYLLTIPRKQYYNFETMKLTNDSYTIYLKTKNFTERYYRDKNGWVKISARRRKFRLTAEQVLNHLLPTLANLKKGLTAEVKYKPKKLDINIRS